MNSGLRIRKTDSTDKDFVELVAALDTELAERDGADHAFYAQFNKIDKIKYALVLYEDNMAIACGAIKQFGENSMEVKRMYTLPERRGEGLASKLLAALENWALELGNERCVLETGKKQPEAISLYKKNGYRTIPNYGQYSGIENSVCFEKVL